MNGYLTLVLEALEATRIHTATTYSWFGRRSPRLVPALSRALDPQMARRYLLSILQSEFYGSFYCQGFASHRVPSTEYRVPSGVSIALFVRQLAEANSGEGYWQAGWEVRAIENSLAVVCKDGLELRARLDDCLPSGTRAVTSGDMVSLRFSKEQLGIAPGFYMALGDHELIRSGDGGDGGDGGMVRLYWNVSAEGATGLVREVTTSLNGEYLPFKLKVVSNPTRFARCDTAVLYLRKADYGAASDLIARIYVVLSPYLRERTPVFTKRLAPGLGLAEDPGLGGSFGEHRCRLLAEAMVSANEQGQRSLDGRTRLVVGRFLEEGISLDTPFLNPGSSDEYAWRVARKQKSGVQSMPLSAAKGPKDALDPFALLRASSDPERSEGDGSKVQRHYVVRRQDDYQRAASDIGQQLVRGAVWHEARCNWVGSVKQVHKSGRSNVVCRALGPDLYDGTSGVGLFLGELYSATGDEGSRRTAVGAIRQATSRADDISLELRLGLYTGWPGTAYATARVGMLTGEIALLDLARSLMERLSKERHPGARHDLLSGRAGAIVGCLALRSWLGDRWLLDFALRLGDQLVTAANSGAFGYSWPPVGFRSFGNLAGFSHGAAGIGYALLRLWDATGDARYRAVAEGAFAYERSRFDAEEGNWPDLRSKPVRTGGGARKPRFVSYWCHGAPGIALSRLYAYSILKEERYRIEAATALEMTRRAVEAALHSDPPDYSLCHGLAGNAEVLLHGYEAAGGEHNDGLATAYEVGDAIRAELVSGVAGSRNLGLMLGLAGTGHFFLRLHDRRVPSILLVR